MEGILIGRLSLIITQVESLTVQSQDYCREVNPNLEQAQIVATKLETALKRFTAELHNYFRVSKRPSSDDVSTFSEAELRGEEALIELQSKIKTKRNFNNETEAGPSRGHNNNIQSSRLPKLDLKLFNGDVLEFREFWDQFQSNIGSRSLSDVDKLLYLKASLEGDAKNILDGLATTNRNYDIAVATLRERYGKDTRIIDAHYAALYKLKRSDKSATECRATLTDIERHLRVLDAMGEDVNSNHLRYLILEKFPEDIVYEMKMKTQSETVVEIRRCLQLIITAREEATQISHVNEKQDPDQETYTAKTLNTVTQERKQSQRYHRKYDNGDRSRHNNLRKQGSNGNENCKRKFDRSPRDNIPDWKKRKLECIFCRGSHFNDKCQTVRTIRARKEKLKNNCFRCFRTGHRITGCKMEVTCVYCKSNRHNRALCPEKFHSQSNNTTTLYTNSSQSSTILQTAVVEAKREGSSQGRKCRLLMDSGSQRTYITQSLAKRLGLPVIEQYKLSVFTFGSKTPQEIDCELVQLQVETRTNKIMTLYASTVPSITVGIPQPNIDLDKWREKLVLADDGNATSHVDLLIGNDYYFALIGKEKIALSDYLFLIESDLGWILSGKSNGRSEDTLSALSYVQTMENKLTPPDLPLDNGSVKCLWDLESIGICDSPKATKDEEAIRNFNETTQIVDNRYIVSWPWKEYPPGLKFRNEYLR